mgnify:CR=1 FL=1
MGFLLSPSRDKREMSTRLYLTIQDVAERFGLNTTTVYHLAQQGSLPGFKIGSQWRFSEQMLERWVAERVNGAHGRSRRSVRGAKKPPTSH